MKGFDIVPVLIGLFGITEVLSSLEQKIEQIYAGKLGSVLSMIPRGAEMTRGLAASVRGTVIGFVFGLLPGMLPALTAYLSYDVERQISRTPEKFGSGMIEGVAAPEAANNATAMAGFIPLLSLGIPTTPALAILLGTLMINGLTPGPMLFQQQAQLVWTVIGSMFIANTALLILNLPLVGLWARISRVPYHVLAPIVLAVAWWAPMRRATPCSTCGWRSPSVSSATPCGACRCRSPRWCWASCSGRCSSSRCANQSRCRARRRSFSRAPSRLR
jgi:putative tricarboxylic transport membrane protein